MAKKALAVVVLLVAVGGVLYSPVGPSFGDAVDAMTEDGETYNHEIGDSFVMNDVSYTVVGYDTKPTVGSGVMSEEADGYFLLAEVRLENVGEEVVSVSSSPISLVDGEGNEYIISQAESVVRESLNPQQLQPDETTTGLAVFEVPNDASNLRLKIENTNMVSGNDVHYIDLE